MRLRKAAGYSNRDDFAKKIGVNKYTYRSWESGEAMMSAEQVWNCAVALGCTPNDILGWYEDHPREDVRQRIASGMVAFQAEQPKEQSRSYAIKKELKRIDRTFERIWQAIEDGIAPPGGKERTEELKQRKSELEAELRIAEREEAFNIGVDELMLWLDDAAENLTPEVILGTFVRFVEIDGKTLNVYFAFDRYGDDFRPKQKKAEPCPEGHS